MTSAVQRRSGIFEASLFEASLAARERLVSFGSRLQRSSAAASSHEVYLATSSARDVAFTAPWLPNVARRMMELSGREEGWDSYGGEPLRPGVAVTILKLLVEFGSVIQSQPIISLTSEGGLVCEWENDQASLEFTAATDESARVYYLEASSGREWDGPAADCTMLEKWLWQASGQSDRD